MLKLIKLNFINILQINQNYFKIKNQYKNYQKSNYKD